MSLPRLLTAALSLLAVVAPAAASAESYTVKTLHFDTVVGPANDTHCDVIGDLYRPAGVDRSNPAPAILTTNGFGGSKNDQATFAKAYATRGYVVLSYSGLGFGGSSCKIELDDPDWDGKAGKQLVDFLGGSKAAVDGSRVDYVVHDTTAHDGTHYDDDPRVGMIGGSYGGEIQFAIAGIDPRMDTLIPEITWNDLSYSLAPNNTGFTRGVTYTDATPGTEKIDWVSLFFGVGLADGLSGASADPTRNVGCPNFDNRACVAKAQLDALGYADQTTLDFARHASVENYISKIRIPTLLAQGQADTLFNLQEATATYKALRGQNTPVRMFWQSWGHSHSTPAPGELSQDSPETNYEGRTFLEWFDYYLRGIGDPPPLDFQVFREDVPYTGSAEPAYQAFPTYPAGSPRQFWLSGTDALITDKAKVTAGNAQFAVPVPGAPTSYTETAAVDQSQPVRDAPGTFAAFSTPPLTDDLDVVGIPNVTVNLSAPTFAASQGGGPGGQLVLFFKLYDVAPDGTITLPHRLIAPVRVADVTKPVHVELPGIVHKIVKGHTLQLTIAAGDTAYKNNNGTGPVAVTVDPKLPSLLVVPRLGKPDANVASAPAETGPDTTKPQKAGAGRPPEARSSATATGSTLPTARAACSSRRSFRIRLRKLAHHDRIVRVTVTVNGKTVKVLRGKRLSAPVDLRGLPRGASRVMVTLRTKQGRTLRNARTYHTCRPRR